MAVKDWSTTASSNSNADATINWAEGQAPSTVNNSARALMAAVKYWYNLLNGGTVSGGTVGGTASAITLTCNPTVDAYDAGQRFLIVLGSSITGSTTLNVDSLGDKTLKFQGNDLGSGDFSSGDPVLLAYDGTYMQVINTPRTYASSLNASNLTSGTVPDARMSSNVVLYGTAGTFSADQAMSASPTGTTSIGFRGAPLNSQSGSYTFVLADAGKSVVHTGGSGHTFTIPPNSSVAFPIGTVILVDDTGGNNVTIARGSGVTLTQTGSGSSANGTLGAYSGGSLKKIDTDTWVSRGGIS